MKIVTLSISLKFYMVLERTNLNSVDALPLLANSNFEEDTQTMKFLVVGRGSTCYQLAKEIGVIMIYAFTHVR